MPYSRPGVTTLRDQALDDIVVGLGVPTLLRRSPLRALGYAQAGLAYQQYGYIDWVARQSVPFTATEEHLEAWGALVSVLRLPAATASGPVRLSGTAGAVAPAGVLLRRGDGTTYVTTAGATLDGTGAAVVPAVAVQPGAAGNADPGIGMALATAVLGVQGALAAGPLAGGADQDGDAAFRSRVMRQWAKPPQGGAADDYVTWALAVPGVTRAWVLPRGMGAGTVVLYSMWDAAQAAHGGFPQGVSGTAGAEDRDAHATGDLLAVADVLYGLQPVTALVYSVAPVAYPVAFNIVTPAAVPAGVRATALAGLDRVFVALADPLGGTVPIGPFDSALSTALGTSLFTLTTPSTGIVAPVGRLPVRGPVTWSVSGG